MPRQFLHAFQLEVQLPNEKTTRVFQAPLQNDLQDFLAHLSKSKVAK
jgi:hypothetical protein